MITQPTLDFSLTKLGIKHDEVKFEAVGRSLALLRSSTDLEYFKINGFTINPHIVQR